MLVLSVVCGYFVNECNSVSKGIILKNYDKNVLCIVLIDYEYSSIFVCKLFENCFCV